MKIIINSKKELDKWVETLENDDKVESYEVEFDAKCRGLGAIWMMKTPSPLATIEVKVKDEV